MDAAENENPKEGVPDFVGRDGLLNLFKKFVFFFCQWIVLAILFIAATTSRVDIFSVGYVIGSFIFFWQGHDFYLKPLKSILKWWLKSVLFTNRKFMHRTFRWNAFIYYVLFVILIKLILGFFGCFILKSSSLLFWTLYKIIKINCFLNQLGFDEISKEQLDGIKIHDSSLYLDCFALCLLILQRMVYSSQYFCYIVIEAKASNLLASRGADLIEDIRSEKLCQDAKEESLKLNLIKEKMDKIRRAAVRRSKFMYHEEGKKSVFI